MDFDKANGTEKIAIVKAFIGNVTKKRKLLIFFAEILLETIYGKENSKKFIDVMIESRWEPIKHIFRVIFG